MIVGKEWIIDASGCRAECLRDVDRLQAVFSRVINELGLQVVGEQLWRQFPTPGGVTGLALLTESHLTCHTYPEFSSATFNLYCCRERPEWPWCERLQQMFSLAHSPVNRTVMEVFRNHLLHQVIQQTLQSAEPRSAEHQSQVVLRCEAEVQAPLVQHQHPDELC